ncbi:hypothetical protein [Acinetobacter courvalinii]|uniref:hypothetical protein n=1 Tax=Acinetobacter courvalinii TaxID=280147 RepID=UPI0018FFBDF9|nr:hypothetical protein [Acinetobacter courvalinii]MBJ8418770.1 hypothetical protein [Acinetobacter courvalinii]
MESNDLNNPNNYELLFVNFQNIFMEMNEKLMGIINLSQTFTETSDKKLYEIMTDFTRFHKIFTGDFFKFFDENRKYINFKINDKTVVDKMMKISSYIPNQLFVANKSLYSKILMQLDSLEYFYNQVRSFAYDESTKDKYLEELREELIKARESVKQVEAAKLALEGKKTEEIYSSASSIFKLEAEKYEKYFYISFSTIITIAIIFTFAFPFTEKNIVDFIVRKVLFISVGITLCTYFLRKASHAKKQYDQSHQTSLELMALPLFIQGLPDLEQHIVIKDLATKYFGKAVDQTQNDKSGDLINDQIKAGTELIRASVEMVKVVKPSTELLKPSTATTESKARATEHTTESQSLPTEKKPV